jgi:predicted dehydrogenase
MRKDGRLGVGVVGLGLVANEHIRGYLANPACEIVAFCSRDAERAKVKAGQLGLKRCRAYGDLDAMLKQDDIDLVSVCTPNNLHVEQGIAVAQAGKHLVMEKPIALDMEGGRALEKAVKAAGVKNVVCFVLHWYPRYVNQLALVKSGAIGDVFYAECEYLHGHLERYESQWRWIWKKSMGGSTLMQGGIHAVDAMRQFMRAPAVEVTAYSHGHTPKYEYNPTIVGIVRFADGAVAKITSSFETEMPYQLNLRLYGTKGTIQNDRVWSGVLAPKQNDWAVFPAVGADSGDPSHHPFSPMVDHIVDAIRGGKPAFPDISDALKSHEIAFAADISADEGRSVKLPL